MNESDWVDKRDRRSRVCLMSTANRYWWRPLRVTKYALILVGAWTLLAVSLVLWSAHEEMRQARDLLHKEARAHFLKDQAFRLWGAAHGGVYVPPTEHTPPNPHLAHIPDRDIETAEGKMLTLMNPAYMVRQLMEDYENMYGIKGRITSLKALRPGNSPDAWERVALESFEQGATEVREFTEIDGKACLRLMRPLQTQKSCLKCHSHQGYEEGDVRGGIGVSVPAGSTFAVARAEVVSHAIALGVIWMVGLVGLGAGALHIRRRVRERDLAEEERAKLAAQLRQAHKMEAVGRLAGGVAHDFNNMLSVILGSSELALADTDVSSPAYENLVAIQQAGQSSAELTRQLLAFARKQTIAPKVLNLNKTISGTLKMLRRLIGEDIALRWEAGEALWSVKIDPSQVDQILTNLCVNARHAIAGIGEITITTKNMLVDDQFCTSREGLVPGEYVYLAVSDSGCGMDAETCAHVFEPFFTSKGMGTGLGLATVYGVAKQNGGYVDIQSNVGIGTTVELYLPRHAGDVDESESQRTKPSDGRGDETVLLVEDEATILKVSTKMLESLGYRVLAAGTPAEAIGLAKTHADQIDLLVTDVIMPDMNGRDLSRHLLMQHPRLKCLFMSGYTADVISDRGVLNDGEHFIQKPFSKQDMGDKVREALEA
jgi:signal transduction histidine kinase/CheY-like chemotaxis protein